MYDGASSVDRDSQTIGTFTRSGADMTSRDGPLSTFLPFISSDKKLTILT